MGECKQRDELMEEHRKAMRLYTAAVQRREEIKHGLDGDADNALLKQLNIASLKCWKAQLELQGHMEEHGCGEEEPALDAL